MGVYVQESISHIPLVFSGIWAKSHEIEVTVCEHNSIVFLSIPPFLFPETQSDFLVATLPGNLVPLVDQSFIRDATDDDGIILADVNVSAETGVITISTLNGGAQPGNEFSGVGNGGLNGMTISYQIKRIPN
jgi:hypothetical protein